MVRCDIFCSSQVRDGAGYLENAIVSAGGKRKLLHRVLEEISEGRIDGAEFSDLGVCHPRVGSDLGTGETIELAIARGLDARAKGFRRFARFFLAKLVDGKCGCLDVNVDAIEKGATDPGTVALDLRR